MFLTYRIPPLAAARIFEMRLRGSGRRTPPLLSPPQAKILKVLHPKTVVGTLFSNDFYIEFSVLKERSLQNFRLRRAMHN